MKRATKILTLILIVVFVLSVFVGCDLIGRDVAKYRATTVMKVGEQEIKLGKLLDTFNTYYNNYYYYVSAGYLTADSLFEMVINSIVQQYIKVDAYVRDNKNVQTGDLKGVVKNAEYLTLEQFEYCIKYVKHTAFTTFDGTVMTTLSVKHDIGDAEAEDTSRDFIKYDDLNGATTYADYLLNKNFVNEDVDEYFEDYYKSMSFGAEDVDTLKTMLENLTKDYVYTTEEDAQTILDELNERLEDEGDEGITFEEYVEAQQKAIDQYSDSIKTSYGITLTEFLNSQVADMVSSSIVALWNYQQYKDIDSQVADIVKEANKKLLEEQEGRFAIADDFDSFITSLSDSSILYTMPQDMTNKYVFVKNILIPFTSGQSAMLSDYANRFGGTDNEQFEAVRNAIATEIVAEYFYSEDYDSEIEEIFKNTGLLIEADEDEDSKYEKIEHVFTIDKDGKIAINTSQEENKESGIYKGILAQFFNEDGSVNAMPGKSESETIIELMKRFNTDVGQHSTRYDYVVYVGEDWEDYKHSWVKEFYTAVNEMGDRTKSSQFSEDNIGKYTMCVSTYGVHIIFVEDFVENVAVYDSSKPWTETDSLSYVRYKAEFDKLVTTRQTEAFEKLQKEYLAEDSNLVTVNKQFKRFLKDNDFSFDFDEYKKETLEELD